MTRGDVRRWTPMLLVSFVALVFASGCSESEIAMPRCRADSRLGIVAQSVRGAALVPCISALAPGWQFDSFHVDDDGTRFALRSDRDSHPVHVAFVSRCDVGGAVPVAPRTEGVRSYQRTDSLAPRYSGRIYDVFPGGCVTYRFDFLRGPHIALIGEFEQSVQFFSRLELRQELRHKLGITLDQKT